MQQQIESLHLFVLSYTLELLLFILIICKICYINFILFEKKKLFVKDDIFTFVIKASCKLSCEVRVFTEIIEFREDLSC